MKKIVAITVVSALLLLALAKTAHGQSQTKYALEISADCSAVWRIWLTGTLGDPYEFDAKIESLVASAESVRGREMSAEPSHIGFDPVNSVVEYRFVWWNFGRTESGHMIIDDVFQVDDFFLRLYGEGELSLIYPSGHVAEIVSPTPQARDDSSRMLNWSSTESFSAGSPMIILRPDFGVLDVLEQNVLSVVGVTAAASASLAGFYLFVLHKRRKAAAKMPEVPIHPNLETDEEKAIGLLKSSGGTMFQSVITERCKFSKAKTSQLLTSLEKKGLVKRYKKGRDKVVVLPEKDKT